MRDIYIITDYRNKLYSSVKYWDASLDLDQLTRFFQEHYFRVHFISFLEVSSRIKDFTEKILIYPSSEDPNNQYKSYIEDIIFSLHEVKAKLIPSYAHLKAHHNKVSMELFRKIYLSEKFNNQDSYVFGTYEEYLKQISLFKKGKWVLKPSSGALSKGVQLLDSDDNKIKLPKKLSRSKNIRDYLKVYIKHLLRKRYIDYRKKSTHREKFIVQKFIPNLTGDYKVLIYGSKYFVLQRSNRNNDFRASGGGKLNLTPEIPYGLLDYAKDFFSESRAPYASLDIAFDGTRFYLIEFQFINFGNYTIENSTRYFEYFNNTWQIVKSTSVLEEEFVKSIIYHLNENRY